jgi:hypothetical protein
MTKLRTTIALTIVASACLFSGFAAAQESKTFARCPANAQQHADVMKVLVTHTERSRAMAEDNPLLLADVGFYEAELAATKACVPSVAMAKPAR